MITEKKGFTPISVEAYIESHLQSNPGDSHDQVRLAIKQSLDDYKKGKKCICGSPIWVIGSAFTGAACFTCITGEAVPDSDYEIDEAM